MSEILHNCRQMLRALFHRCKVERKSITFIKMDGKPNGFSIYGPCGSVWAHLAHCAGCGTFRAHGYNTYGACELGEAFAEHWWPEQRARVQFIGALKEWQPGQELDKRGREAQRWTLTHLSS